MLNFPTNWRFESPGESLSPSLVSKFDEFVSKIAAQGDRWDIIEHFKYYFVGASGGTFYRSSSLDWAESDLDSAMRRAAQNPALFIEAFYDACKALVATHPNFGVPDIVRINRLLRDGGMNYEIRPPALICHDGVAAPIAVPERQPSLDEQAQNLIQQSLRQSEELLQEGRNRQAVSEILWLLETVTTAFRGLDTGAGTIQAKYFNKIAHELRRQHEGQMLEHVLDWIRTLHGFLSSPTGGGVRHGVDIKGVADMPPGDARLYCNLIRSYITYLIAEHERISASQPGAALFSVI